MMDNIGHLTKNHQAIATDSAERATDYPKLPIEGPRQAT